MNAIAPIRAADADDQPPDGGRPYRFTFSDVLRMIEAEIIDGDANIELLEGELIEMPSEGALHVWVKNVVSQTLVRRLPERYSVMTDSTLQLSERSAPDPDVYVAEDVSPRALIRPDQVRLVIEVADSSATIDLAQKARIYARHGISDYWVLDIAREQTHVLRGPNEEGYRDRTIVQFDQPLQALDIPELAIELGALPGLKAFGG